MDPITDFVPCQVTVSEYTPLSIKVALTIFVYLQWLVVIASGSAAIHVGWNLVG